MLKVKTNVRRTGQEEKQIDGTCNEEQRHVVAELLASPPEDVLGVQILQIVHLLLYVISKRNAFDRRKRTMDKM